MKENVMTLATMAMICLFCLAAMDGDYEDSKLEAENYCEMHRLYLKSNGENGWPDFNRNYAEVCE